MSAPDTRIPDTGIPDEVLGRVAAAVGTPAYVYDAEALRGTVARLRQALPEADFFYSMKANPNLSILRLLAGLGMGAEVCSLFEIETCVAAGVAPARMIVVGPAKSDAELARAVSLGVKAVIAESLQEIVRIGAIAARMGRRQRVGLRINPDFHVPGARLSMSGKPTQFGIDEGEIGAAIAAVAGDRHLRLSGLHVYMGTRILDHDVIVQNSRAILALAARVRGLAGHPLDFVDIGGGFGVAYSDRETDLDLAALGRTLGPLLREQAAREPGTRIVIELGRYVVAAAGSFVTRVRYTKVSKGVRFAICDGGSNCHAAAGQAAMFRSNFPMARVGGQSAGKSGGRAGGAPGLWMIAGPLCTPTDIIGNQVAMADLSPGDLIRIDRSGGYGPSASPVGFLSFGTPAEVLADGRTLTVIRERATLADHLAPQTPRPLTTVGARKTRIMETL
jgi:diaminopimelate decarboxylase